MSLPEPLFDETRKEGHLPHPDVLNSVELPASVSDPEYDRIARVAAHICESPIALISVLDANRLWFRSKVGWNSAEAPRTFFCTHALKGEGVLHVPDTAEDDRFRDHDMVRYYPNIRFYAGVPLVSTEGQKLGTLCIMAREPKTLTEEQLECLETLARQIVVQIEMKRQQLQLQQLNVGLLNDLQHRVEQKDQILKLFSRFVPPEVIAKHLRSGDEQADDAELKYCSILFCDIRGYTSIAEKIPPKQAVAILQTFYSVMSDVIRTYSGVVVQYVGDEIFALFGKPFSFPQYERNAVFCALDMIKQLEVLNEACRAYTDEPLQVGIGINAGEVITGTLGSDEKIEFTVTGNHVNTAKRIESLTKSCPNTILISETVFNEVKHLVNVKTWDPITVKGKSQPLQIFEVLSRKVNR